MPSNGLRYITTTTFTTASTVSVDNCFSSTYKHYLLRGYVLGSTGTSQYINLRLRASGTDASGSDYRRQFIQAASTSPSANRATTDTSMVFGRGIAQVATAYSPYNELWLHNPYDAVRTTAAVELSYDFTGNISLFSEVGAHGLTTQYDGCTIFASAGTITGQFSIFGLAVS